jgi:hypothetical protein
MCHETIFNECEGQENMIRPEVLREFLDIKHKMNDSIQSLLKLVENNASFGRTQQNSEFIMELLSFVEKGFRKLCR